MKSTLLKEEYQLDMLEKSIKNNKNNNQDNYDNNKKANFDNLRKRRQSKLQVANRYIAGFVNDLKETIAIGGYDDNIFSQSNNQKQRKISKRFSMLKGINNNNNNNNNENNDSNNNNNNNLNSIIPNRLKGKTKTISKNSKFFKNGINRNSISKDNYIKRISLLSENNNKNIQRNSLLSENSNIRNRNGNSFGGNSMSIINLNKTPQNIVNNQFTRKFSKISNLRKTNTLLNNESNSVNMKSAFKKEKRSSNLLSGFSRISTMVLAKNSKLVKFKVSDNSVKKSTIINNNSNSKDNKYNKYVRRWSEYDGKGKKKNSSNDLFSFFLKPQYFEDNEIKRKENISKTRRESKNRFHLDDDENSSLFEMTKISNKEILELNELSNDLKKSLILTPKNAKDILKKTFIGESVELFKKLSLSNLNASENENESDKEIPKEDLEKYRELQKKGLVYDSLDEYNDQDIGTFFINPNSKYLIILDCFIFFCTMYVLIAYPLFLGINEIYCRLGKFLNFKNAFELFVDFVFFVDFIVSNFIGFYNSEDVLQTNLRVIIPNNLESWFIFDLVCAIPFKTIFSFLDTKCQDQGFLNSYRFSHNFYYLWILVRCIKVFKILQRNKFLFYLDESLDSYEYYNNYVNFYKNITICFVTFNFVSCIFIFLGKNDYSSWIVNFGFEEEGFLKLYFLCVYYLIETVTTVGYGDLFCITIPEKIFGIVMEFGGIIAYSWLVSSISNYVKSKSDQEEEYRNKYLVLQGIKKKYPNLSDDLFERINRYIKHKQNNEDQEKNLIEELPISLKNILVYDMYEPIIRNFIFFKNFDNKDFIVRVIFCFKPILAIKNDILIKDGDFIEDIIFVKRGRISLELPLKIGDNIQDNYPVTEENNTRTFSQMVTAANQTRSLSGNLLLPNSTEDFDEEPEFMYQNFKILDIRKNEHFGDVLMFSNERSPLCAIVKSRKAELFYLKKSDAIEISQSYPQIWQKITKKSLFNMKQIRRLMAKVINIFNTSNGLTAQNQNEDIEESNTSQGIDGELQSIPSSSDINNIKNKDSLNLNNLKTIKESEIYSEEGFENISSSRNSDSLNNVSSKNELIKKNSDNDNEDNEKVSNSFTYKSKVTKNSKKSKFSKKSNDNETFRITHLSNRKVDFSESLSDDFEKQMLISKRSNSTPYLPDEINNEIYPNENFMKYKEGNDINHKIINNKINNINNDNISICSTEISFSISSKYENIDELSDYRYSKISKLRKKIKLILKDEEYCLDSDSDKKISSKRTHMRTLNHQLKNCCVSFEEINPKTLIKYPSDNLLMQKKKNSKKKVMKKKKKHDELTPKTNQNYSDLSLHDLIQKNSINNNLVSNEFKNNESNSNSFSNFFNNFMDKEIKKTKDEIKDDDNELSKKLKKMENIKKNLTEKNQES